MRATQYFSDDYLHYCKTLSAEQILQFLEDFRLLNDQPGASKLVSIKIPENMLSAFKYRCKMEGILYQTQIKRLMKAWLQG